MGFVLHFIDFTSSYSVIFSGNSSLTPARRRPPPAAALVANEILSKVSVELVGGTGRLNRLDERWAFRDAL